MYFNFISSLSSSLFLPSLVSGNEFSSITGNNLIIPTDINTGMFAIMYLAGTRVFSNSWGTSNRNYDSQARQVDQFMWNHPDALVLFSAGTCSSCFIYSYRLYY